jgi:GSH-dependent disulfide-bond oxidoreductase
MAQRKKNSSKSASKSSVARKAVKTARPKPKRRTAAKAGAARRGRPAKPAAKPGRKPAAAKKRGRRPAVAKPIALYYWPTPNGWKIVIFLEEAGLSYEIKPVNIGRGEQFAPEFLKISPNNRMPALVDPAGPGGRPLSIFESGAILRYLGEKTGKFYPADLRGQAKVDEWLFWQVGGLGPMAGQASHFRRYAPETLPYAVERYTNEVNRLYGVLESQFRDGRKYIAGRYSIADMAIFPWILPQTQGQDLDAFPFLKAWFERMSARRAVRRSLEVGAAFRQQVLDLNKDEEARKILFGQRARLG